MKIYRLGGCRLQFLAAGLLILSFQNCGPAKLVGEAWDQGTKNLGSGSNGTDPRVGSKVDIASLLQSPHEPGANVLFPSPFTANDFGYSDSSPVIENLILKKNDFDLIEWVHAASGTVMAVGDKFNQTSLPAEWKGTYDIIGYRKDKPYVISQLRLTNKTSTTVRVDAQSAVQITQKVVESDGVSETILVQVDAPSVDLSAVKVSAKNGVPVYSGQRALLITKRLLESVDLEFQLADQTGGSLTTLMTLPSKASPSGIAQISKLTNANPSIAPGQTLALAIPFIAVPLAEDDNVFVSFFDENGVEAPFSATVAPTVGTSKWSGATTVNVSVAIPPNVSRGNYSIRAGIKRKLAAPNDTRIALAMGAGVLADGDLRYGIGVLTVMNSTTVKNVVQAGPWLPAVVTDSMVNISFSITSTAALAANEWIFFFISEEGSLTNAVTDNLNPLLGTTQWDGSTVTYSRTIKIPAAVANGNYVVRVGAFTNVDPWPRQDFNVGPGVMADTNFRYIVGKFKLAR